MGWIQEKRALKLKKAVAAAADTEVEEVSVEGMSEVTIAEIKNSRPYVMVENRVVELTRKTNRQAEKIADLLAGVTIPEAKIIEWRERCFFICEELDRFRDNMREILLEIEDFPHHHAKAKSSEAVN